MINKLVLIVALGLAFFASCRNDERPMALDPLRKKNLLTTTEWQSFNEAWMKYNEYRKINAKDLKNTYLREPHAGLLRECLKKADELASLKKDGLITDAELNAMKEYFSEKISRVFGSQVGAPHGSEVAKKMYAESEEEAYRYLKKTLPILENLARQNNCIRWVKEDFVGFIKMFYSGNAQHPPEYLAYWKNPVSIDEVTSLQKKVTNALETIEKTK
jgi:hypothetical protein